MTIKTKRTVYIALFALLGLLLATLLHAAVEIALINLLTKDFARWSLGLTWEQWFMVHHVGAVALGVGGLVFGYKEGVHWWRVIYVDRKYFP